MLPRMQMQDPLSKTWGFRHTPHSSSLGVQVQPHSVMAPWGSSNPSNGMQPLAAFPAAAGESGKNGAPRLLLYRYTRARTQKGCQFGPGKGNVQVSRFPGRRLPTFTPRSRWGQNDQTHSPALRKASCSAGPRNWAHQHQTHSWSHLSRNQRCGMNPSSGETHGARPMQVHIFLPEIFHPFVQRTCTKCLPEARHCENNTGHILGQR